MVTINPAECDRTTVYTGECRNLQDTEWIRFDSGRRRSPNAHDGDTWLIDVGYGSFWVADDQVRNLVRLVPARPITRDDLPDLHPWLAESAIDQVVDHINDRGGLGIDTREPLERALRERDEWKARAEAAEARTAPAVTKAEIENVVRKALVLYGVAPECVRDAVWSLVSGFDPAVFVVRESDLPEVQRREDGSWAATPGLQHYGRLAEPAALRRNVKNWMVDVAQAEAVARAIEAGQATDPVEDQTDALADILYGDELVTDQMRGVLERVVRAGMLFPGMEADQ